MKVLNKTKNTVDGVFWGVLGHFISMILSFVVRSIIIKTLGNEYVGLNGLFSSILTVLNLAELGFGSALVYGMYKPIAEESYDQISAYLSYLKKAYLVIGLAILFCGIIVVPFLPRLIHGEIPPDVNLYFLFSIYLFNTVASYFLGAYRASLLSAFQRQGDDSRLHLFVNTAMYIVQIIILLFYQNYYYYVITIPVFTIIYNVSRYIYVSKKYPDIRPKGDLQATQKAEIKNKAKALLAHKIGGVTVNSVDNIVISAFLGLTQLALYNNYYIILSAITSIVTICFRSLTAGIGNNLIVHSKIENRNLFFSVFCVNGAIVSVSTTCLFSAYQDFVKMWVGEENTLPIITVILICLYYFIHTIRRTIIMYRDASGLWEDNRFQPLVSAAVNLVINISLVNIIGLNGIIISTIISMVFVDIPWESLAFFRKQFNTTIKRYVARMLSYLTVTIVSCALTYIVQEHIMIVNKYLELAFDVFIAVVISIGLFLLVYHKNSEMAFLKSKTKATFKLLFSFTKGKT